jgi:pyruvate,water dikinase
MVPLMAKAGGIICDIGSMMSHPAIVARELGIPCIVAAHSATQILKTDQIVQMDGSSGVVLLVDE